MQRDEVLQQLKKYIAQNVLDGRDIGLDETTPLLEWGIINSLEVMRLLTFIRQQFHIDILPDEMIAENFINLSVITNMVIAGRKTESGEVPDGI